MKNIARRALVICITLSLIALLSYYWYLDKTVTEAVSSIGIERMKPKDKLENEADVDKFKDSLLYYKMKLEELKQKLNGYSKVINVSDKQNTLNNKIQSLDAQIEQINSYNEVLPSAELSIKRKGEIFSGETSSLILYPPTNLNTQYLDFSLLFVNDDMVKNVACLYAEILKKNQDGSLILLWDEYYLPRKGCNKVRIKNDLKQKDTEMRIGFFWKCEYGKKDYPRFEYVRFSMN